METQTNTRPSILNVYNETRLKDCQTEDAWIGLARLLADRIPDKLQLFATKTLWVKTNPGGKWLLPMFLENLIKHGIFQKSISMPFAKRAIFQMGFANSKEFIEEITKLQSAWFGLVTIHTDETDDTIDVIFQSTET